MQPKFNLGYRAYIIESSIYVKEVEIVKVSGGFYLIKYPNKTVEYRVKESILYKNELEAKLAKIIKSMKFLGTNHQNNQYK